MKGILIRVGADGTDDGGNWNAPVDPQTGQFVYVPITESVVPFHPGCERRFDEVADPLLDFLSERGVPTAKWQKKLDAKRGQPMHLDPDFETLTYGDDGDKRGRHLREFQPDDVIVFFSGLQSLVPSNDFVYALIGVYIIEEIVGACDVDDARRRENAHTRKQARAPRDIVVRARPGVSGRCERCIPIGEKRGVSNYYLRPDIEAAWGGLLKGDGTPRASSWISRSAVPPLIGDPKGFLRWWQDQGVSLHPRNFVV